MIPEQTFLAEAIIHLEAANRWLSYGLNGRTPVQLAEQMYQHHRRKAVGWLLWRDPMQN